MMVKEIMSTGMQGIDVAASMGWSSATIPTPVILSVLFVL
jgi:hypothetical protein